MNYEISADISSGKSMPKGSEFRDGPQKPEQRQGFLQGERRARREEGVVCDR